MVLRFKTALTVKLLFLAAIFLQYFTVNGYRRKHKSTTSSSSNSNNGNSISCKDENNEYVDWYVI